MSLNIVHQQPAKADGLGRDPQTSEGERKGLANGPRRENGAQERLRKCGESWEERAKDKSQEGKGGDEGKEEGEGRKAEEKGREADKKPTKDIRLV